MPLHVKDIPSWRRKVPLRASIPITELHWLDRIPAVLTTTRATVAVCPFQDPAVTVPVPSNTKLARIKFEMVLNIISHP